MRVGKNQIEKTIRPQLLNLERDVRELNHKLLNGTKKVEGIEDKILSTQRQLDLAKAAYAEKFGLNPDEITGSPV